MIIYLNHKHEIKQIFLIKQIILLKDFNKIHSDAYHIFVSRFVYSKLSVYLVTPFSENRHNTHLSHTDYTMICKPYFLLLAFIFVFLSVALGKVQAPRREYFYAARAVLQDERKLGDDGRARFPYSVRGDMRQPVVRLTVVQRTAGVARLSLRYTRGDSR